MTQRSAQELVSPLPKRSFQLPGWLSVVLSVVAPAALLIVWFTGTNSGAIPAKFLPSPAEVWDSWLSLSQGGEILTHLGPSIRRAVLGLLIGGALGFIFGLATALSRIADRLFDPTLQGLRTIPPLALLSLFILWFGIGEEPKITLIALGAAFPIYISTGNGIRGVDWRLLELASAYRVNRWTQIRRIVLPQALPVIFGGIRLSASISIMLLVAAEQTATQGLGFLLVQGQSYFDSAQVILIILIYALLGVLADTIIRLLQWLVTPWTHRKAHR